MARHKKLKPIDHKYLLKIKRAKIHRTVDYVYLAIILPCILICGLNQSNALIVGLGLIIMGVISAPVAVFYVYTLIKGWVSIFWYDYPEVKLPASREMREKEEEHDKLVRWFLAVFLILFSIGLPIGGILKLVEYFGK